MVFKVLLGSLGLVLGASSAVASPVLIGNQRSHGIKVFRRDPASGAVKEEVQTLSIDQASDIKFLTR